MVEVSHCYRVVHLKDYQIIFHVPDISKKTLFLKFQIQYNGDVSNYIIHIITVRNEFVSYTYFINIPLSGCFAIS